MSKLVNEEKEEKKVTRREKEEDLRDEPYYDEIESVYTYLVEEREVPPERIMLFGRSVGSGPTCYLAQKYNNFMGVILESAFMSILNI